MSNCEHAYHVDGYPEICDFENYLDSVLKPDGMLDVDQIRIRDNLIEGVQIMYSKVCKFKSGEVDEEFDCQEDCDL